MDIIKIKWVWNETLVLKAFPSLKYTVILWLYNILIMKYWLDNTWLENFWLCMIMYIVFLFSIGCIFCDPKEPIRACTRFRAKILLFNIEVPITKGFPVRTFSLRSNFCYINISAFFFFLMWDVQVWLSTFPCILCLIVRCCCIIRP